MKVKDLTQTEFEVLLKNCILRVRDREKIIEETTSDVWGVEVRRLNPTKNNPYAQDVHKLETWKVPILVDKGFEWDKIDLPEKLCERVNKFEVFNFADYPKRKKWLIYELCDWCWLKDENGRITQDGGDCYTAALVKYAVVLPKLKGDTK